jgi:hypothetical protein
MTGSTVSSFRVKRIAHLVLNLSLKSFVFERDDFMYIPGVKHRLTAIQSADFKGFSPLMGGDEDYCQQHGIHL